MVSAIKFVRGVMAFGIATAFVLTSSTARADEEKGKPKGMGEPKPNVLQLDLNKLPPDLAKQLQKYLAGNDESKPQPKGPAYGKGNPTTQAPGKKAPPVETKRTPGDLPPGLASKPADHPGRINFLLNAGKERPVEKKPTTPEKGKGPPGSRELKGKAGAK